MPKKPRFSPPLLIRTPELLTFYEQGYRILLEAGDQEGARFLDCVVRKLADHQFGPRFIEAHRGRMAGIEERVREQDLEHLAIPLEDLFVAMYLLQLIRRAEDRRFVNEQVQALGLRPLPKGTNFDWLVKHMREVNNTVVENMDRGNLTPQTLADAIVGLRSGLILNLNLKGFGRRGLPRPIDLKQEHTNIVERATPLLQVCRDLNIDPQQDPALLNAFPEVKDCLEVPRYPVSFSHQLLAMKYGVRTETIKKSLQRNSRRRSRRAP